MFKNEAPIDFSLEKNRTLFAEALSRVENSIRKAPFVVTPIVDGKYLHTNETYLRPDPANPATSVAEVHMASDSIVNQAIALSKNAAQEWADIPYEKRAQTMRKAAALMRQQRFDLCAIIVREAGKPWKEADADVVEAIDFCEYYAEQMERLGPAARSSKILGEENWTFYQPRGVAAVISPWNFPLAITCGMTVAALVCGNSVLLKPSRQTSYIAFRLSEILLESGVPSKALSFLPGSGARIGNILLSSPDVNMYCFTGSREVGLEIISKAAIQRPGQTHIKRVIAELGGKNAIIVDEDADLDEAVKGIMVSAFGYAGQKCSACSRVIAVGSSYEPMLARLCAGVSDIIMGSPSSAASFIPPVIDAESQSRILGVIEKAKTDCTLAYSGETPKNGFFVPPTIFRDVPKDHFIWREEIFGPVLACAQVKDFSEAIALANDCDYALTGGVFSRSPANIDRAKREFRVGNLYINRSCTGAIVERQPFGGFKMSGIGSKAGGVDYLLQFMEPRCVSENSMRRGFAPED